MKFNAVAWFEIPVSDMSRAKKFYQQVVGAELSDLSMDGMEMAVWPMDMEASGSAGALVKHADAKPTTQPGIMVYFHSLDVSVELGRVEAAGGHIAMPKTSIGEHGFIGSFIDTEGNLVSLHSRA